MSSTTSHSLDDMVLDFPKPTLSRANPLYEYDATEHPPEVEPIEHRIRQDFAEAGLAPPSSFLESYSPYRKGPESADPWASKGRSKPQALVNAQQSINERIELEDHLFKSWDGDSIPSNAPGYLQHRFAQIQGSDNPQTELNDELSSRKYWYEKMPWSNLFALFTTDSSLGSLYPDTKRVFTDTPNLLEEVHSLDTNSFEGAVLVDGEDEIEDVAQEFDLDPRYVYPKSEFDYGNKGDSLVHPDEYIESYPAPVVIGNYANGSSYLLLPWTGGLTCQCHYKHERPYRVMCKHEALASMLVGEYDTEYLPIDEGIDVPDRVRKLYDPLAADW